MINLEIDIKDVNFAHDYDGDEFYFDRVIDHSRDQFVECLLDIYNTELIVVVEKTPENVEKIFGKETRELYVQALEKRKVAAEKRKESSKRGWEKRRKYENRT